MNVTASLAQHIAGTGRGPMTGGAFVWSAASIDVSLKIVASAIAIVTAWIAILKYFEDRSRARQIAATESRKPFATTQQDVYLRLVSATAVISNRYGQPDWDDAFRTFWILFWGEIPLVADEQVSAAVDRFADTLDDVNNGVAMRNASMELARACRRSLGVTWGADFAPYDISKRGAIN